MSTVTNNMSPIFKRPWLRESGFTIKRQTLHCFEKRSISIMWSILIKRERSSLDLLCFFVTGDKNMLHFGHLSFVGLNVLGHPEVLRVSVALHCFITLIMLLFGILSFWYSNSAVLYMYFCVLEQLSRCKSQCNSWNANFVCMIIKCVHNDC